MKKYTSAALLALSLTWKTAALVMLLGAGVQALLLRAELMPGGIPLQTNFSFGSVLENSVQIPGMVFAAVLMAALLFRAGATRGSKSIYTMKRLRLREVTMTLVFGGVFTGYFLIYWAVQMGLCFVWFAWYSRFSLVSSSGLMLAAWDSAWFHYLLPLEEWFGYVRNFCICLSFGHSAALGSIRHRRGKHVLWSALPCVLALALFSGSVADPTAFFLALALVLVTVGHYLILKGGMDHEDAI